MITVVYAPGMFWHAVKFYAGLAAIIVGAWAIVGAVGYGIYELVA